MNLQIFFPNTRWFKLVCICSKHWSFYNLKIRFWQFAHKYTYGINLGKINGLDIPRCITILHNCSQLIGFVTNEVKNDLVRLTFPNGITSIPVGVSLGNFADFSFPHKFSNIYREGDSLYSFVPNVLSNSLSRICFPGCTNKLMRSSTLYNPPPVSYNTAGTYTISLATDEGLPTQVNVCKQIVVLPAFKSLHGKTNIPSATQIV